MKKDNILLIILVFILCACMYTVEQILHFTYVYKTLLKVILFFIVPFCWMHFYKKKEISYLDWKKLNLKNMKWSILLSVLIFIVVLTTYFFLQNNINLSHIREQIETNLKITPFGFIFVAIYISLGNSFLEEFFFRGFIFGELKENKPLAFTLSSLLFAFYHIGMIQKWFSIPIFILAIVGLFIGGSIFNKINERYGTIFNSWLIHMSADISIMLIGFHMFGFY